MEGLPNRPTKRREVITIDSSSDEDDPPTGSQRQPEKRVKLEGESTPSSPPAALPPLGTPLSAEDADALRARLAKSERQYDHSRRSAKIAELRAEADILEKNDEIIAVVKQEEERVKKLAQVSKEWEEAKTEWAREKEEWAREREEWKEEQNKLQEAHDALKSEAHAMEIKAAYDALKSEAEMKAKAEEFEKEREAWNSEAEALRQDKVQLKAAFGDHRSEAKSEWKAMKLQIEREREAWRREKEELKAAYDDQISDWKEKEYRLIKEKEEWTQREDRLTTSNAQLQRREVQATQQKDKLLREVDELKSALAHARAQGGGSSGGGGGGVCPRPDGPPSNVALTECQRENEDLKKKISSLRRREKAAIARAEADLKEKLKEVEAKAKIVRERLAEANGKLAGQSVPCSCRELNEHPNTRENIMKLCRPDINSTPFGKAITDIRIAYKQWLVKGRAFRPGQDFKKCALRCDVCSESVPKQEIVEHFLSQEHLDSVERSSAPLSVSERGVHVSSNAVRFWLDLLQKACVDAAAAAVDDAAAELAAIAAQQQQQQQQKPMAAQADEKKDGIQPMQDQEED